MLTSFVILFLAWVLSYTLTRNPRDMDLVFFALIWRIAYLILFGD